MKKENIKRKIIAVVGPTASGKSDLAIKIALKFKGEIVSCDSMQIYKSMDIGTAKPSPHELSLVPHHLIDIADIGQSFCVSDYVELAKKCVEDISERSRLPVFCGGTGLYIDSLCKGTDFGNFANLPEYRAELEEEADTYGNDVLLKRLYELDPEYAQKLNLSDRKRIIRGLEICRSSGDTVSEFLKKSSPESSVVNPLYIGLYYEDRELLYERINKRVDLMVEKGLIEEAEKLYREGIENSPTAGQAIGYKEFYPYFKGTDSLENCISKLKQSSRHYAKRQLTWFRRNKDICWLACDGNNTEKTEEIAYTEIEKFLNSTSEPC